MYKEFDSLDDDEEKDINPKIGAKYKNKIVIDW